MLDANEFREEARAWLEANCPISMRTPMLEEEAVWGGRRAKFAHPDSRAWLERMGERGWTAPTWPRAYGGGGLSQAENTILQEELQRIGARVPLYSFGLWMFGPVLLEYGTEEQKRRFIPDIVRGRTRWCQGYSEPGAGSDLASLATRCEDRGDHFLVNGQKVWTSYADEADWIFCLVRTDPSSKHGGISFIVFDMETPGVETRPITLISGDSPFCEIFLVDVRVPKENLIGPLNGGWEIAKRLLTFERQNISVAGFAAGAGIDPVAAARECVGLEAGQLADRDLRTRIAGFRMFERAFHLTALRAETEARAGRNVEHLAPLFKVSAAALNQLRGELLVEALGIQGLGWEGEAFDSRALQATRRWLRSKGNSIEGGTTEINLNVIAKRVLGLADSK